jgi:hypothetical protein
VEKNSQFDKPQNVTELSCGEFDALLSDALDGVLTGAVQRRFEAHRQTCLTCGPLFHETSLGMNWLESVGEIEAPPSLMHNILAATSMQTGTTLTAAPKLGWKQRLSEVLGDLATPFRALAREPRFAMTAAMAIFSVTLTLNLAGVRLADLRHINLRPSAIRETAAIKYTETTNRVIHYYYSIRLVYEVESRLQELKRATGAVEGQEPPRRPDHNKTENQKNDRDRKQNYYSMERQNMLLAKWSANDLNRSSILGLRRAAMDNAAGDKVSSIEAFSTAELSRGLRRTDLSMRSLLA